MSKIKIIFFRIHCYDVCSPTEKQARKMVFGVDINYEDLVKMRITKNDILEQLKTIKRTVDPTEEARMKVTFLRKH